MTDPAKDHTIGSGVDQPKRWKRRFIDERATPAKALSWRTPGEKAKRLDNWRVAVGKTFSESARVLRIAWALEWMFGKEGFAYATDSYLGQKLGIPVNKIQSGLTELERAGAIIRASVFFKNKAQRRIWPSSQILRSIPPMAGGMDTPHDGPIHTPHEGGTEYLVRTPSKQFRRFSATLDDARKSAEIRERAAARRRSGAPDSD
jgi:hypothetical protein